MSKKTFSLLIVLVFIGYRVYVAHRNKQVSQNNPVISGPTAVLGAQTKVSDCTVRGPLPDALCTPGAVISTATKEQICVNGYTKTVRNVPDAVKSKVFSEYGISSHTPGQYEVDHLVSLELGGSNDIANLWPEAADPTPGFHEKDGIENTLHSQVCNGTISLAQAQAEIAKDWQSVYKTSNP